MSGGTQQPWWRGSRGEWYVAAQMVLIVVIFFGPRALPGLPAWPAALARPTTWLGAALMFAGAALLLASALKLGSGLTPLPYPVANATLARTGAYGLVRHPMYAGGVLLAYGWAGVAHGTLTLLYATILLVFFDIKSRREERWLEERFVDYPDYRRRVRKLIPFIY